MARTKSSISSFETDAVAGVAAAVVEEEEEERYP
jgi:hypothetical protein